MGSLRARHAAESHWRESGGPVLASYPVQDDGSGVLLGP